MERLAPVGDVYQAGTLSGNPLATAAGVSVLRRLRDPAVYEELERLGARLEEGLAPFGTVQRVGGMLTLFCHEGPLASYDDASACDTDRFGALFRHLLAAGVYVPPSQFECLFPSTAHTDDEVDATVGAVRAFFGGQGAGP
jgi:glutamate-1-semialdehyde 2,1-aminomutase